MGSRSYPTPNVLTRPPTIIFCFYVHNLVVQQNLDSFSKMSAPATRRHIENMASRGKYYEADCAVNSNKARKQAMHLERQKDLEEEQSLQWQSFNNAKQQFNLNAQLDAVARKESKREQLKRKQQEDRVAHRDDEEAFALRLTSVIMRRPVPVSIPCVELRRDEKRLASQSRYVEAAATADVATRMEAEVLRRNIEEKERLIESEIQKRAQENRAKELTALKNARAKMLLEENKARVELECARARLKHMEADMSAAHERQRRELKHYGYVPNISTAQRSKASRGSSLEKRVMGDRLPSLTAMYGSVIERELHRSFSAENKADGTLDSRRGSEQTKAYNY
eukprot:gene4181-3020_t